MPALEEGLPASGFAIQPNLGQACPGLLCGAHGVPLVQLIREAPEVHLGAADVQLLQVESSLANQETFTVGKDSEGEEGLFCAPREDVREVSETHSGHVYSLA